MKLVVNMVMGSMMVSFAEGLSLAQKVRHRAGELRCQLRHFHCNNW